ncbi:MAG: NifB/NifX family molybdenum-iron cluster-binding protein [Planctomycetota bacterium]
MRTLPHRVAIPHFGEAVAPCYGASATVAIFTIENGRVVEQRDFTLTSPRVLDRVRLLRDQGVDTLICGGVQDRIEDVIRANGIRVLSWVSGNVERLLEAFLRGELASGAAPSPAGTPPPTEERERRDAP